MEPLLKPSVVTPGTLGQLFLRPLVVDRAGRLHCRRERHEPLGARSSPALLRARLDEARSRLSLTAIAYGEAITAGATVIKAVHFTELRNGVK